MLTPLKSQLIDEKVSTLYKRLRSQATCEPAIVEGWTFREKPSWYDEDKFKRAQRWAYYHFVSVFLGHLTGLLVIFNMPSMMPPVAKTKSHSTVAKLFNRYLDTFRHVKIWYESDPFMVGSDANKSLRKINNLHCGIVKSMNGSVPKDSAEPIWVSQYDMVLILWSIMAPIILFHRKCGIHSITRRQMEDLIHFWAVVAYALGIKDENNILRSTDYDEVYGICDKLLASDVRPVAQERKYPSNHGYEVSKVLAIALQPLAPIISLQGLMRQWYRIFGITASIPVAHKFGYKSAVTLADTLLKYSVFRFMFAVILKFMLILRTWQRAKITDQMNALYPDDIHPDVDSKSFTPAELLAY
ncbi:uncharacterized protein LOC128389364 [Panonychus citri]|uniref:uncharacterized protein LOC128389364 n=1 Tax=Panonychus citri TaxID=50023 RepID=UPI002307BC13|nr:uncharacterized protein LOC128389364 [Panonychus citri]XP_053204901.1 uncharacterized protein LOC128389364 [Panonychus citri]XP_053204902.1 uncharacterized protein LOC128389364 [Panonychus citri]XP_053204903.1 uncharacterized protein LOC128389364 [Panonychus citri]